MPRFALLLLLFQSVSASSFAAERIDLFPRSISLDGRDASQGLLVLSVDSDGYDRDLTRDAKYQSADESICRVDDDGIVSAIRDGRTVVEVHVGDTTLTADVRVTHASQPPVRFFETDVVPIFSRHACNSSGCHGKAEGQNGFKLSVFGFDPHADFVAIVQEGRGRRVSVAAPESSLLLAKASGDVAHGGGVRLEHSQAEYRVVRDWIAAGATLADKHPQLERIELHPRERILRLNSKQQLRLTAHFDDGSRRDVTSLARFRSNNEGLAMVDDDGLVHVGSAPGHVAIMASFLDQMDTLQVLLPNEMLAELATNESESTQSSVSHVSGNFIDEHVDRRLARLNIVASPLCDDATFQRRVYLDIIGTLPTTDEARRFLEDKSTNKRAALVDALLNRPEYAAYWSLKWSDTLRVDRAKLGHKAAYAYYKWIRGCFEQNLPLDKFAAGIVAADGPLAEFPQANFYKAVTEPGKRSSVLSQVFLGVRIECAECHHHPYDLISQTDYHGMRAFFEQVSIVSTARGEIMSTKGPAVVTHPRSGEPIKARALYETPVDSPRPRRQLAEWLTAHENPWFSKNMANRLWAHFMGRGLVEPVDDLRATNPPTNPELLDALAKSLAENGFDAKSLIRQITASQAYQRATTPNNTNARDEQNYSRALFKRMDAEVLLDAVCQVTGRPEKFENNPIGVRAIELWDSGSRHYFLKLFGRPLRKTACECERNVDANVAQILHMLNSTELQGKLVHPSGHMAVWNSEFPDDSDLIEQLYLSFFGRKPSADERRNALTYFADAPQRKTAIEDLGWSMLNSYEFLFNH
ncbi:MAG: DUF1553 domain-containing protein [Planctomycetales bacterium]|nr:DUF1553 domain-containing protein [Planctomycetales bacterium]